MGGIADYSRPADFEKRNEADCDSGGMRRET
jgi:hypothetical protein